MQLALFDYQQLDTETRIVVQQEDKEFDRNMSESGNSFLLACKNIRRIHQALRYKRPGFDDYCNSKSGLSRRTAYKMLSVAQMCADSAHIPIDSKEALYLLASPSTPEKARQEAISQASNGKAVTHSAAKEIVTEHKNNDFPRQCPVCDKLYDGGIFQDGCPYCYKEAKGLTGWVDDLPEKIKKDSQPFNKISSVGAVEHRERPKESPIVHFSSETNEWYTPKHITDLVLKTLGTIDLDPCSNPSKSNIPALKHYTKGDDGLSKQWRGRVYMNPPYGREIKDWVSYLVSEYQAGRVTEAIALTPARTDTEWFRMLEPFPKCFIYGRLSFVGAENNAPFPSMVTYLGGNPECFIRIFQDIGGIYELAKLKEK